MKILHTIRSINPADGGTVEAVRLLAAAHIDSGHQVEVATFDDSNAGFLGAFVAKVHALGPGRGIYGYCGGYLPWLREHAGNYDAVIVNGLWQYHGLAVWRALRKSPTPYFVFPHGMLDPWFKRQYPLKHLKKWLYWPWAEYRVLRDARAVCFTCEEERQLARSSFPLYRCREAVVPLGTHPSRGDREKDVEAFLRRHPLLCDKRVVLFLGRIHPKKGCDLLVRAWAELRQRGQLDERDRLVIAGPDQSGWQPELMEVTRKLAVEESVHWLGPLAGAEKWGAIRFADAFVLPSHQENFGIAVVEALACGAPVLISRRVNIWREIEEANAGLTAADTLEGTVELLRRWKGMSDDEKHGMRLSATRCFAQSFDIRVGAEKLIEVLIQAGQKSPDIRDRRAVALRAAG